VSVKDTSSIDAMLEAGSHTSCTNSSVSAVAETSLQPVVFWPAHRGLKSLRPRLSALARSGATADAASGKSGAKGLIGPSSSMMRFTMPRAAPPVKTLVSAVARAPSLVNAVRCKALVVASGHKRYAVPTCTPAAPSWRAALTPFASAIPPAAITGTFTARTICGTSASVPIWVLRSRATDAHEQVLRREPEMKADYRRPKLLERVGSLVTEG
jgi:hypothetical protein